MDLRVEGSNPSSHPKPDLNPVAVSLSLGLCTAPQVGRPCPTLERYDWPVVARASRLFFSWRFLIVALMLTVVIAVMFGIDLINGRWDQPPIQPQLHGFLPSRRVRSGARTYWAGKRWPGLKAI